jgi:hypothetical protein
MIEPNEVIDVGMRDKHVGELEDFSHAETVEAPEVEEHSPPLVVKADEKNGILERSIDETGRESVRHNLWSTTPASPPQVPFL